MTYQNMTGILQNNILGCILSTHLVLPITHFTIEMEHVFIKLRLLTITKTSFFTSCHIILFKLPTFVPYSYIKSIQVINDILMVFFSSPYYDGANTVLLFDLKSTSIRDGDSLPELQSITKVDLFDSGNVSDDLMMSAQIK